MSNINREVLKKTLEKLWLTALKEKNLQSVTKFVTAEKENSEFAIDFFKQITAVEFDKERFAVQFENEEYAFVNEQFPLSTNIFKNMKELRICNQPDDLRIYEDVFEYDIKKILLWDKPIPEKYCDIQKTRNSLKKLHILSKNAFDCLSIISPSCRNLKIQCFKLENIKKNSFKTSYPSIEHLIIHDSYIAENFNLSPVIEFSEFVSRTFPNLKKLDIVFDYLDKYCFEKVELVNLDPEMFKSFPSEFKGTIKFNTFKFEEIYEKCAELVKKDSSKILCEIDRTKAIKEEFQIHDGLIFESIINFYSDYSICWHPFFGYKCPPTGPFWFQHTLWNSLGKSSKDWLTD